MSYIYLASPYSHPDAAIREARYQSAMEKVNEMLLQRKWVYSPILHNHPIACRYGHDQGIKFWLNFDLAMLGPAIALHVLTLPNWENSEGVKAEIAFAKKHNKAIYYV